MTSISTLLLGLALASAETDTQSLPSFVHTYIEQAGLSYEPLRAQYSSEAEENIAYLGLTNPRWVAADFNGDGREDWAGFLQTADGQAELVAVYSFRSAYSHETLAPLGSVTENIGYGLILESPGSAVGFPIDEKLPTPTATFAYPAIHLVYFEKVSVLFYWQDGAFHDLLTGD